MLPEQYQWIAVQFEPDEGDADLLLDIARGLVGEGNLEGAATVFDRAYGIAPRHPVIWKERAELLNRLAVVEHDIRFCYIPGGPFLMGSNDRESDEAPWHPVWLSPYWLSQTPISWEAYCRLLDWEPPPRGMPREFATPPAGHDRGRFHLFEENKVRLQYCEDHTTRAVGWHAHDPVGRWSSGGQVRTAQEVFGSPPRTDPNAPWEYRNKPMIGVSWQAGSELADHLSTPSVHYSLPTEAQWEKAARGGLIGARHAWGDAPPSAELCDFDRFAEFSIQPMTTFPPNGYGLYAMNGCVWEWTADWYDSQYYSSSDDQDPKGPAEGREKVLRGGSWSDCADVLTVSFRMSRESSSWRTGDWGAHLAPNIGFRLCRQLRAT
jgi:formylglycine-generating enzyme required for sulfatase activity